MNSRHMHANCVRGMTMQERELYIGYNKKDKKWLQRFVTTKSVGLHYRYEWHLVRRRGREATMWRSYNVRLGWVIRKKKI
jgi:hypothetical protein